MLNENYFLSINNSYLQLTKISNDTYSFYNTQKFNCTDDLYFYDKFIIKNFYDVFLVIVLNKQIRFYEFHMLDLMFVFDAENTILDVFLINENKILFLTVDFKVHEIIF